MTYPENPYQAFDKDGLPVPPPAPQNPFGQPAPQSPYAQQQQFAQQFPAQPVPPAYGQPQYAVPMVQQQPKQMIVAALLAFFLGGWGAHNFYLGNTNRAVMQLIGTILGLFTAWLIIGFFILMAIGIWVLVEFVMILAGSSPYDRDANGVPLTK
ncbi:TM2 domain protein [Corynebacterium kalinowskii]|uniref:TM2 domain protein n=1 Tax=Corynebacterium kalinowskii TaxID=2675216 RepID=A0A6B8W2W7_9CORY|nr:TM2 domain-containing protein [Corynebacterium kalinowskii]QGU01898.1 TM2 domain protein [Corynebacterium kalinowskii]